MCPTVCGVHHPEWRATRIACNPARSCPPPSRHCGTGRDKLRPQKTESGTQESRKNSSRSQLYPGAAVFTILDSERAPALACSFRHLAEMKMFVLQAGVIAIGC